MTSQNHIAFLMHPTSRATHLGGTPLESGGAGGRIKKATWEHAFAAALRGLPKAVSGDQALAEAHLGPLLLCGAALELVKAKNAVKTARVCFELPLAEPFDLKLAGVRNNPGPYPIADGALIAAQRTSRQLLIAVMAGNLFWGHGVIMALAIWHLP